MKNTNTNSIFIMIALLVAGAIGFAIWWGVSDMFAILTHNDWLASLVALIVVLALATYATARLRADDVRTAGLTLFMAIGGVALVTIMFVATSIYNASGSNIANVGEAFAWSIPLAFALPVLIGNSFFIIESLDRWWLTDKKPSLTGAQGKFVDYAYRAEYNIGIIAALVASAVGTYSVMFTVTKSFWHALIYVLTVEAGIYIFSSLTHRTRDRQVFWASFLLAQAMFFLAILFQFGNAGQNINGMIGEGNLLEQLGNIAINFYLIPPLLVGVAFGGLFIYNQTKKPDLFISVKNDTSEQNKRSNEGYEVLREKDSGNATPEIRVERVPPKQVPAQSGQGGGSSHGKRNFAEPGGLPQPLVARLKSIGYSGNEIRKMTLPEARAAASKPKTPQSQNGAKPESQEQNFE